MSIVACAFNLLGAVPLLVGRISRPSLRGLDPPCRVQAACFCLERSAQASTAPHHPRSHCASHRQKSWRAFASCGASSLEACTQALRQPFVSPWSPLVAPKAHKRTPQAALSQLSPASALFPCSYSPVLLNLFFFLPSRTRTAALTLPDQSLIPLFVFRFPRNIS